LLWLLLLDEWLLLLLLLLDEWLLLLLLELDELDELLLLEPPWLAWLLPDELEDEDDEDDEPLFSDGPRRSSWGCAWKRARSSLS
jgi:hypothetical protein